MIIAGFKSPGHEFMSNFFICKNEFTTYGLTANNSEVIYQAMKTDDMEMREKIVMMTPGLAKKFCGKKAGNVVVIPYWDKWVIANDEYLPMKVHVMKKIVWAKFRANPLLAKNLAATLNDTIIECNMWHDNTFGMCLCPECTKELFEGKIKAYNFLGQILMGCRAEARTMIAQGGR
jgi:predicted NAD-dependent protein-ADP-ribosyltransferase YbiA (DUF1768 family)